MNNAPRLQWSRRRPLPLRLMAVILIFVAASAGLLAWKRSLQTELELREHALQLAAANIAVKPPAAPAVAPNPAKMRHFREQAALLNRNWAGLSESLMPRRKDVRLLSMDVNPATGAIRLGGSAGTAIAANAYAASLGKKGSALARVRLLSVERQPDGVRFEVAAQWAD